MLIYLLEHNVIYHWRFEFIVPSDPILPNLIYYVMSVGKFQWAINLIN